jgi:hypothetical protein
MATASQPLLDTIRGRQITLRAPQASSCVPRFVPTQEHTMTHPQSRRVRAFRRLQLPGLSAALALAGAALVSPAQSQLNIIPTFDASITGHANAATIMATINSAIAVYESTFNDPITVNIKFSDMGSGLGASNTWIQQHSYTQYRTSLAADATSADDATALATLPVQATSPVDGNTNMWVTFANLKAIGINPGASPDGFDGSIGLNLSIINFDRVSINPANYDLFAVAGHEIDEVLGLGSGLNLPLGFPRLSRPQDLFRYSANGVRSYTTSSTATSYLSIDGGATNLVGFNQNGGGDYGDWFSLGPHTPRVQDAFGTPGATPNFGVELTNLDVIGYTRVTANQVPEPSSVAFLGTSALGLGGMLLRRRARRS